MKAGSKEVGEGEIRPTKISSGKVNLGEVG
jgi:hypothetical protein